MAKHCKECGKQFTPRQYNGEFCCTGCRKDFNNRRATRGAMLYDLLMIEAHDPDLAKRMKLTGMADALVSVFRTEDEGNGRLKTWKSAGAVSSDVDKYLNGERY